MDVLAANLQADDLVTVVLSYLEYMDVVKTGDVMLVERMLSLDPEDFTDWGMYKAAVVYGNVPLTRYLLKHTMCAARTLTEALTDCAACGSNMMVSVLAQEGARNEPGNECNDVYIRAIRGSANMECIRLLTLYYPILPQWADLYCYHAVYRNKVELTQFFLTCGAELPELLMPELAATLSVSMMSFLMNKGAVMFVGETIMAAAERDNVHLMVWLLHHAAHHHSLEDLLSVAMDAKSYHCARWLVDQGASLPVYGHHLLRAASVNDLPFLALVAECKVLMEVTGKEFARAFSTATRHGHRKAAARVLRLARQYRA